MPTLSARQSISAEREQNWGSRLGPFADKLLGGPTPWHKMRQAYKLLRLGDKYTPLRLNSACEKALAVDLIDVRRLERILIDALEQEAMPARMMTPPPPGRFARPGNVFAIGDNPVVTTPVTSMKEGRYDSHE